MTLTPKNWKTFQHYKDREPTWIKLHKGLLDDFAFSRLPIASRALAPMLWLLASEYDNGEINCTFEEIAFRLHMLVVEFDEAIKPLIAFGFFISDSNLLAKPERNACLEKDTNTRKEEEIDSRSKVRPERAPSRFEEFWKLYPRRDGPNPRKPAEHRFNALVHTGVDPQMLIDEVRKFAALDDTRKNIGSRFIPQAVTWLNQQRWSDHAAVAFLADEPKALDWDIVCINFKKYGIWSKHAPGNDPGSPSCLCPPEVLEKHGLLANLGAIQ